MNICIFCSANDIAEKYMAPARGLARQLAEAKHTLIWGGSNYGVMKAVADSAQEAGGKIVGITIERYKEFARPNADEMILAKDLGERKALFLERSDALVVTPGGIGTLDEMTEILELKKQGRHSKPILVLNTDGFYDHLQAQFVKMAAEGFLPLGNQEGIAKRALDDFIQFMPEPKDVMDYLANYDPATPLLAISGARV